MIKLMWRKWYFWVAIIVIFLSPFILLLYALSIKPPGIDYYYSLFDYTAEEMEKSFGPPMRDEYIKTYTQFNGIISTNGYARSHQTTNWYDSCITDPINGRLNSTSKEINFIWNFKQNELAAWKEVTEKGSSWSEISQLSSSQYDDFIILDVQLFYHRLYITKGNQLFREGKLDVALKAFEEADFLLRANTTTIHQVTLNQSRREYLYRQLNLLPNQDMSLEEELKINKTLTKLRRTAPQVSESIILYSIVSDPIFPLFLGSPRGLPGFMRNIYRTVSINKGAKEYLRRYPPGNQEGQSDTFIFAQNDDQYTFSWLRPLADAQKLKAIIAKYPSLEKLSLTSHRVSPSTNSEDKLLMDLFFQSMLLTDFAEVERRAFTTKQDLYLAASASRIYKHKLGTWPDNVEQLSTDSFSPAKHTTTLKSDYETSTPLQQIKDPRPYTPFYCGYIPVNQSTLPIFLSHIDIIGDYQSTYHLRNQHGKSLSDFIHEHLNIHWTAMENGHHKIELTIPQDPQVTYKYQLLKLLYKRQLLASNVFPSVTKATIYIQWDKEGSFEIISDQELERLGKEGMTEALSNTTYPPGYVDLFTSPDAERSKENVKDSEITKKTDKLGMSPYIGMGQPYNIHPLSYMKAKLEVTIELPCEVFAIWSVGPDGINDYGLTEFHSNNTTNHKGDIIIFPGGL
jgi:hypothetical protein